MKVTRWSPVQKRDVEMDIPNLTPEQLSEWESGSGLIQDVLPHLSSEEREFLISGCTPEDWNTLFGKEE